jgi:hypothetical protein
MIEATRRNQIGQPAAWRIANNAYSLRVMREMYGKARGGCKFARRAIPLATSSRNADL